MWVISIYEHGTSAVRSKNSALLWVIARFDERLLVQMRYQITQFFPFRNVYFGFYQSFKMKMISKRYHIQDPSVKTVITLLNHKSECKQIARFKHSMMMKSNWNAGHNDCRQNRDKKKLQTSKRILTLLVSLKWHKK